MARIVLADDNADQVTLQHALLTAVGHEVFTALCAAEALHLIGQCSPDLVTVDLRMPSVADGLGLIRSIRESGYLAPIILLSGWPDDIYGTMEEKMVSQVILKGNTRELLALIAELTSASAPFRNLP
jgi:CheY-like chemotaxis protein